MGKNKCPRCGKLKTPWFKLCFECNKKDKQIDFKERFNGKYYFNGQKVKSKSELLLLYFFEANDLKVQYETPIYIEDKCYHPDFIIQKGDNVIIIEHFGMKDENYQKKKDEKIKEYQKLIQKNKNWFFVWTDEGDIKNLKDRLGMKLNQTPLKKVMWK